MIAHRVGNLRQPVTPSYRAAPKPPLKPAPDA